jgi:uncharacterized repeat protein (TIGR03803 family)
VSNLDQLSPFMFRRGSRAAGFAVALLCVFTAMPTQPAQAQTFSVIHQFTGGNDGRNPLAGLTMDRAGNFYGTTSDGGVTGEGVVFKMTHKNGGWLLSPLYNTFGDSDSGEFPESAVTIGANGSLYGTTISGGTGSTDAGTLFNLTPPARAQRNVIAPWTLTVLHDFGPPGGSDGALPAYSVLVFDSAGNIYGTTSWGGGNGCGGNGCGTVFKLTPTEGDWTETILYTFTGGSNGFSPEGGVIFDSAGNLYGTASSGGMYNCGTVFKLTPTGSGWVETTLHLFLGDGVGDGCIPVSGLIFDGSGNLYGTTYRGGVLGGDNGAGTVFELVPQPDGGWSLKVLWAFTSGFANGGPLGRVTMDTAGNLYGSTSSGGAYGLGAVFELTPSSGGWAYTSLHDFIGNPDGEIPMGNVLLDANGNLYGTAEGGGQYDSGVVWEITP